MSIVQDLKKKVLEGNQIKKEEALALADAELEELCNAANEIREAFCQNGFDICAITNGKGGKCSENCKYCAQAGCSAVPVKEHALLSTRKFVEEAKRNEEQGVLRYSIVTSGKRLNKREVDKVCESIQEMAGGRGLLPDKGERCFRSGANAAISGDMLTTSGITVQKDMEILKRLGYVPKLWEE